MRVCVVRVLALQLTRASTGCRGYQAGHDALLAAVAAGGAPAEHKDTVHSVSPPKAAPAPSHKKRSGAVAAADEAKEDGGLSEAAHLQKEMAKLQAQIDKLHAPAVAAAPSRPAVAGGKGKKGAGKGEPPGGR